MAFVLPRSHSVCSALLAWEQLNPCLPMGSSEGILCLALLVSPTLALLGELSSQTMSSHFYLSYSLPHPTWGKLLPCCLQQWAMSLFLQKAVLTKGCVGHIRGQPGLAHSWSKEDVLQPPLSFLRSQKWAEGSPSLLFFVFVVFSFPCCSPTVNFQCSKVTGFLWTHVLVQLHQEEAKGKKCILRTLRHKTGIMSTNWPEAHTWLDASWDNI